MPIDTSTLSEHSLSILRRDFVTEAHCAFCTRKLPSGTALILNHPALGELPAGTSCGPKWGFASENGFPDFTKYGLLETNDPESGTNKTLLKGTPSYKTDREYQRNIAYLTLRAEKLPALGFVGLEYSITRNFHEIYRKDAKLSLEQSQRLTRFIDSPNVKSSPYSYHSLMLAYTHSYWLNQCVDQGKKKLNPNNYKRLLSFREQLLKKWRLTDKQIECLNRDLAFIFGERAPTLDPEGFAPYRPQPKTLTVSGPTPAPGKKTD